MSALFVAGIILLLLVSFAISAYITFHKFSIESFFAKMVAFTALGTIISVVIFTVFLTLHYT